LFVKKNIKNQPMLIHVVKIKKFIMPFIENKNNSTTTPVKIFYEVYGEGKPVILIHGWPVSHEMWEYQISDLVNAGFQCIAYDRRGFGKSDKPWQGYNYDDLTSDLAVLIDELRLSKVSLVGFSMGGGEVVRYISTYGSSKIAKAVLVSSVIPLLVKTPDHENGVPPEMFDEMATNIKKDRVAFLTQFGKQFFGEGLLNKPVSQEIQDWMHHMASLASPKATLDCAIAFSTTDFRNELNKIDVPTLIIHGDADKTVPIEPTSELAAKGIGKSEYVVFEGAPHGLFITHKEELNAELVKFLSK
jgi:non-heme chloroperoxidase